MHLPTITSAYLAVLALIYAALGLRVSMLRRQKRAAFGDGTDPELRSAVRAHAHFAEYVPIIVLMAAMLEMSGLRAGRLHLLLAALLVARLLHPIGMSAKPGELRFVVGRVGGMTLTIAVMVACAVSILSRLTLAG